MKYCDVILINEIEQRAKIIFLSASCNETSGVLMSESMRFDQKH